MPSEFNHIDEFIRNKEKETETDLSQQEIHWNQMHQLLTGAPAVKGKVISGKFLLSIVAGIMVIGFLGVLLYQRTNRSTASTIPAITVETRKPVIPAAGNDHALPPTTVVAEPIATTKKAVVRTDTNSGISISNVIPSSFLQSSIEREEQHIAREERGDAGITTASFFASLEKPAQEYLIHTQRDTTIVCDEGTSIHIPASSFITKDGKAAEGTVSLRVKEYYEMADIIANKLTTSSNSELLETGGMLHIEAMQADETLALKKNTALTLQMPTKRFDPNMQLFYGEELEQPSSMAQAQYLNQDRVNWNPAGQKQYYFDFSNRTIHLVDLANDPREVVTRRGKKIAKFILAPYYSQEELKAFKAELMIRYGYQYDELKLRRGWREVLNPVNSPWPSGTPSINGMVGYYMSITLKDARTVNLISSADSAKQIAVWREQLERSDSLQRQYLQFRDQYSFNINRLGWINCDKLLGNLRGRTRFVASIDENFQDHFLQSFLVFKDLNTVAAGVYREGKLTFENMPVGKPVALICVGIKNGKAYSCVKETRISPETLKDLEFEETTPEKFRENLQQFGNVKG